MDADVTQMVAELALILARKSSTPAERERLTKVMVGLVAGPMTDALYDVHGELASSGNSDHQRKLREKEKSDTDRKIKEKNDAKRGTENENSEKENENSEKENENSEKEKEKENKVDNNQAGEPTLMVVLAAINERLRQLEEKQPQTMGVIHPSRGQKVEGRTPSRVKKTKYVLVARKENEDNNDAEDIYLVEEDADMEDEDEEATPDTVTPMSEAAAVRAPEGNDGQTRKARPKAPTTYCKDCGRKEDKGHRCWMQRGNFRCYRCGELGHMAIQCQTVPTGGVRFRLGTGLSQESWQKQVDRLRSRADYMERTARRREAPPQQAVTAPREPTTPAQIVIQMPAGTQVGQPAKQGFQEGPTSSPWPPLEGGRAQ
jgi:hypothetical protein